MLLMLNKEMNGGKQILACDFLKQIDPLSDFMRQYENQRHMRRAFEAEYRISSFNYVLLLFESVNRILTVVNARYE